MKFIDGGVTSPIGFLANGVLSGIKSGRTTVDTALIYSEKPCNASGVFTKNRVQAEPVKLTKSRIENHRAQAIIANSGNANACTGKQGEQNAIKMAKFVAKSLFSSTKINSTINENDVLVCSTGVIGKQLNIDAIENHVDDLVAGLSKAGHEKARCAIMTTDTHEKECAIETEIAGKTVRIGTMAKGSGMIHINMGTMLGFITTDCAINAQMLDKALHETILGTYNCISIDGDTSTNDTLLILANGMAGNAEITSAGHDYDEFLSALNALNTKMARKIARDGEGASRLIECNVNGAVDVDTARKLAKSVISSSLVKAAFFGKDANWGRILCALGYSGAFFTPEKTSVSFASKANGGSEIQVFERGTPLDFDEVLAKQILSEDEVKIIVTLEDGNASGTSWGCDLTYDYVKINGDYRT